MLLLGTEVSLPGLCFPGSSFFSLFKRMALTENMN